MTDDLVKRLRVQADSAYISSVLEEAADRIEKLEMLLHGEKCLRQDLKDTAEAHSKQQRDRIEKLEAANLKQSLIKVDDKLRIEKLEAALLTALGMLSERGLSASEKCELAYEHLLRHK